MSDGGERTCPLCAEEMDLTDQQLKPCKCGYEICVWCWHQIMDMAEKDETTGRCPACRTPYNKEKIVGMAASCERLVAGMNMERKHKSQKAKNRASEGRKQLSSVRVIQRNLAYIVGMPLNLADEDLLQQKDYFGQYGKVLKVSISRTAAGTIQHFANNSCSVYITYSKEEEAIRCIQSVHGFILEGRSLRACFGTTKYCHAWLRNVTCSNPDCLYLHEIGSHDDSFTKDEIISAYTRSRVQQIPGATNGIQRRSGNVLPPPADEYCNDSFASSGKPITKSASNIPASSIKGSPPNISPGRSVALPAGAAWGMRSANNMAPPSSLACTNGPSKQKTETYNTTEFSTAVASTIQVAALHGDIGKMLIPSKESYTVHQPKGSLELREYPKHYSGADQRASVSEAPVKPEISASPTINSQVCYSPASKDKDIGLPPDITNSSDVPGQACGSCLEKNLSISSDENIQSLCLDMSSVSIDRAADNVHSGGVRPNSLISDQALINSHGNRELQHYFTEQFREPLASVVAGNALTSANDICVSREQCGRRSEMQDGVCSDVDEDVLPSDDERLKEIETSYGSYLPNSSQPFHHSNCSLVFSARHSEACGSTNPNVNAQFMDRQTDKGLLQYKSDSIVSNGWPESQVSCSTDLDRMAQLSYFLPNERRKTHLRRSESETATAAVDMGENNIISNILSMDFDTWDESLTSPQNFAKLLGESGEPLGSFNASGSLKVQNSNQSRFSFARQEDSNGQVYGVEPSISNTDQMPMNCSFSCDFTVSRDSNFNKVSNYSGLSSTHVEGSDNLSNSCFHLSSNKLSVSRGQVLAPPGFSLPSRAPPPGFTSQERVEQVFDTISGSHLLNNSSFRSLHQGPSAGNLGTSGEIEFVDPAILAVGKGRLPGRLDNTCSDIRSGFAPRLSALENQARLQLLMQGSLSPHQNLRFLNADSFSSLKDTYGIPSRIIEQSASSNLSPYPQLSFQQSRNAVMSNGHWDGWHEAQNGTGLGMADLLRNERPGFNKFFPTYEDSKFRMPSSGRTYGI